MRDEKADPEPSDSMRTQASTAAGLTATVSKDDETGEFCIEVRSRPVRPAAPQQPLVAVLVATVFAMSP
jgi:hypothetical protein